MMSVREICHGWELYTTDEMMTVAASRELGDGTRLLRRDRAPERGCEPGPGARTRPGCFLIYESGTLGAKPDVLPLSIGDGVLAEHADSVVPIPEVFNYWLQAGRVDVGFLGAAQIDRFANINTTVVGPYDEPEGAPTRGWRCARRSPPRPKR